MKFPRSPCLSLVGAMASAARVSGFVSSCNRLIASSASASSSVFVSSRPGSSGIGRGRIIHVAAKLPELRSLRRRPAVGLGMIFGDLFRGLMSDGGAFAAGIDYSELDHPGLELADAAENGKVLVSSERNPQLELATFAGGCFWGLELAYQRVPGVEHTAVGYTQGRELAPTYSQVGAGATGHTEAVIVYYDPSEVGYDQLLDVFFARVDPLTVDGQGNDFGRQYRTGVFFHTSEQEALARVRFQEEQLLYSKPIATELRAAIPFWPAEKHHQQYLEKGGRNGVPQSAKKGATETIRCYG